jgi:hypothetical protein
LPSYYDSYQELLLDENYKDIIISDDVIYSVERQEVDADEDLFQASVNENGEVSFEVRYYNGGCSFNEAIEEALGKIDKQ